MAEITVLVCDECGASGAATYTIGRDGQQVTVDLCEDHAAPVDALRKKGRPVARAAKSAAGRKKRGVDVYEGPWPTDG